MGVTIFNSKCVVATLFVILGAVLCSSPGAYATTDSEPNYATATVDGDIGEWYTDPDGIDFFAEMILAWGNGQKDTVLGNLFLRYDFSTNTLFMLALTADLLQTLQVDGFDNPHGIEPGSETWVTIDDVKVVSSISSSFAWVDSNGSYAKGFEASFPLSPEVYQLVVHTLVYYDNEVQTSALLKAGIPLYIVPETAEILYFVSIAAASGLFAAYKIRKK